jgi:exopolysaccharide production protein ExoQ
MPPTLALYLTLAFIGFLFWRDIKAKANVSRATWIPLIWFFLSGSLFVSQWLSMIGIHVGSASMEDGSPLDAGVFFGLIVSGVYILHTRRVSFTLFRRQNLWITVFLVYCFLAVLWSDFPFVAFKRWIKVLGHPIMVLVLLTENDPKEAIQRVLKRSAYLLMPLSIVLCKYFPEYGRRYNIWTGVEYYQGAMTDKNGLGHACMIVGIFFFWYALQAFHSMKGKRRVGEILLSAGFLAMALWLLKKSDSATSLLTTVVGISVVSILGLPFLDKRRLGIYFIAGGLAFIAANSMFGVYENLVHGLGRNLTLTDRTNIWATVLQLQPNPIFGAGFESFWLGNRLESFWSMLPQERGVGEAHNGYLEMCLNLGFVGLIIFGGLLVATFYKIRLDLVNRFELGRLRMGIFVAIVIYNFTEAAFVSVHFIYAVFFLIAMDYAPVIKPRSRRPSKSVLHNRREALITAGAE